MPVQPRRPITVSIVSHGQQALVAPLLRQLEQHCVSCIDKVVLTINLPEPDLVAGTTSRLTIQPIPNARPQGFGANHNAAFAACDTEWFLVLNPDIRMDSNVLKALLDVAQQGSGLLTPRILEPGKSMPEPHRALLTPREILRRNRAGYVAPKTPLWVPGMFMLLRSKAFRQIQGFDPRFFMYGEDFDICARLRLAGWKIQVAEHMLVRHEAQRASRRRGRHLLWHCASLVKVWSSSAFWRYRRLQART